MPPVSKTENGNANGSDAMWHVVVYYPDGFNYRYGSYDDKKQAIKVANSIDVQDGGKVTLVQF